MNVDLKIRTLKAQINHLMGVLKNETVKGTGSSTDGNVAVFDGQDGKKIKDSGKSLSSYVEGASSSTDGNIPLFDGTDGKKIKDSGKSLDEFQSADGWHKVNETWTYASATTINVPSGATSRYQKGDRVKLTQGGTVKYFYIVNVASTLLTITGGSDYTLANATISDIYISRAINPQGFPLIFNAVPILYGATVAGNPTYGTRAFNFTINGRLLSYVGRITLTSKGGMQGEIRLGGFPVPSAHYSSMTFGLTNRWSEVNTKQLFGHMDPNTDYIRIFFPYTALKDTDIQDNFVIWSFCGQYFF